MEVGGAWRAHNVGERVAPALCDRNGSGGVGFSSSYQLLAMLPEIRKNIQVKKQRCAEDAPMRQGRACA